MVRKKIISVIVGIKVQSFNISTLLPIAPKPNDSELKSEMEIYKYS